MDFPSAGTFGLLPGRQTAIALSSDLMAELMNLLGAFDSDEDEGAPADGDLEVLFEPWDEEMGVYVVADMLIDDDDTLWDEDLDSLEDDEDDDEL